MTQIKHMALAAAFFCSIVSAAPVITSVTNAANGIPTGSPLAQGCIIVIYGTGLGPSNISIAPTAFQSTTLSATSVTVTVGTTTLNAPLSYTSATQVAALLPSNTPTGTATFAVTYNGQTSPAFTHGVTSNNVGIFTVDSSGQGAGIVTYADYSLVSPVKSANCGGPNTTCGATNPGDTLILWGTGLGPVTGGSDASGAGLGKPIDVPLTVWLGGVQAPVVYQGRSGCCVGEDQIVFTVPGNVPTGCAVPLVIQIGTTTISNTALIAVANGSRSCTPVNPVFNSLTSAALEQLINAGSITVAQLDLEKDTGDGGVGFQDNAQFQFFRIGSVVPGTQPFFLSFVDNQPVGTCVGFTNVNQNNDIPITAFTDLNAGSSFSLKGPAGSINVTPVSLASKSSTTLSATGTFLVPGSYTVTGTGGPDIGAFTASFSIAALPALLSPAGSSATVTRANGLTVTWTPGASGNVEIQLASASDSSFSYGFSLQCVAPASAGTFTIPPYALLSLAAGNFAYLSFSSAFSYTHFAASGLNLGLVQTLINGPALGLTFK